MTKKEQVAFAAAQQNARINRALRWSDRPSIAPDITKPEDSRYSSGWLFNAYGDGRVERAWSDAVSHGTGAVPTPGRYSGGGTQGGRALYSTRALALRAMRCEMEARFARVLATVDEWIDVADADAEAQ